MKGFIELIVVLIIGSIIMKISDSLGGFVFLILMVPYVFGVLFWVAGKANK